MTRLTRSLACGLAVSLAALLLPAYGHGSWSPEHGGTMGDALDEISHEYVFDKGGMRVYLSDHGSPAELPKSATGKVWRTRAGKTQEFGLKNTGAYLQAKSLALQPGDLVESRVDFTPRRHSNSQLKIGPEHLK